MARPLATRALVLASVGAALLVCLGAFGPWGALSLVPEQAAIVSLTRWIAASLAIAGAVLSRGALHRAAAIGALLCFAAAAAIVYGEMRYEENQAFAYGVEGPRWGLQLAFGAALGGAGVWAGALVRAMTKR